MCRGALCENQQWSVVVTLFGLLGCSVAITLKRELLLTLAAVSKTPLIATNIWQTLEASQVAFCMSWILFFTMVYEFLWHYQGHALT